MRFCFVVLVAAVAFVAGNNGVSANSIANSEQVSKVATSDAIAEQNEIDYQRLLKSVYTEEEDENRAMSPSVLQKLKSVVWKIKFTSWYSANKTPTQVNKMLLAQGKADWSLATAYAAYFSNLKYGAFAIDKVNKEIKENEGNNA
ncbi:unnamed protein product [Phytophthora lilii]|uniref:RxLR effector protein n=1 Tax=Phytophthora lilii TaxID=2077276 RepID=A0A9W6WV27_9STRA|nr:unnamed protein product [Phytophthora lilii]